ncbi:MAG: nuclear transport factor 2 family protein [Sphingobium sp.]
MGEIDVRTLQDREALRDILSEKWCRGVDKLNWKLIRTMYEDEVTVFFHDPALPGVPEPRVWPVDEWLHFCRAIEGFDVTSHHLSNYRFEIEGDAATVNSYLWAQHILNDESYVVGGEYTHKFHRTGAGWKLNHIQLEIWWTTGEARLFEQAMEMAHAGRAPRSAGAIRF